MVESYPMSINPKYLGADSSYQNAYDNTLLEPIPRALQRNRIGLAKDLPFYGKDIWNAYEISWLNSSGKPMNALGEFYIPCESAHLIESKSLKLYLVSFSQSRFKDMKTVQATIAQDLSQTCGAPVEVMLTDIKDAQQDLHTSLPGILLDDLDITCDAYQVNPDILSINKTQRVTEILTTNMLKSNCLVTQQPDWGSLQVSYTGPKINRRDLLQYVIGFREHNEFHEHCVERIFMDLLQHCQPEQLTVYARYTRRGGLDINPYRSTSSNQHCPNIRLIRQ